MFGLADARGEAGKDNLRRVRLLGRQVVRRGKALDVVAEEVRGAVVLIQHAVEAARVGVGRHRPAVPVEVGNALLLQFLQEHLFGPGEGVEPDEDHAGVR